jgi:dihydroneopterin aldolase
MGVIRVEGISVYAYHGCLEEEAAIGSEYRVDVKLNAPLKKAAASDNLADTIDYVVVHRLVREEMAVRAKLLEVVAERIILRLKETFPQLQRTTVRVAKLNPPINGIAKEVSVTMKG